MLRLSLASTVMALIGISGMVTLIAAAAAAGLGVSDPAQHTDAAVQRIAALSTASGELPKIIRKRSTRVCRVHKALTRFEGCWWRLRQCISDEKVVSSGWIRVSCDAAVDVSARP
ncbi:MAG: hypothetical protein AAF732_07780 [Pseudomonadota bacterium]